MISFPVLERVRVQNYALYVGTTVQPGMDHTFRPGVNVIVGINGLGKTTLLNTLLRSLAGAMDVPGDDELGEKKRRLVPSDRYWFRRRVPDDAVNAQVTVWFYLGSHYFEVTRSLANLDIVELTMDQQAVPPARATELEAIYRDQVMKAAGLTSFEDFVFLLRYVVFYLEDRRSLVWDAAAQGDILGILFGEQGANRQQYVEIFNELLSKDSEYRNMFAVVNKRRKDFVKQASSVDGGQVDMLIKTIDQRRTELADLATRKVELATVRDSLREQIENRRQEIHDNRAKLALSINSFYESFFPTVGDAGRYLLAHFDAAAGCLVCGSRDQKAIERVSSKLYMNTCPICESKIEDPHGPTTDPHAGELIEALRATIAKAESDVEAMQTPLRDAEKEYADVAAKLVGISSSLAQLDQQLMALGQSVPNAVQRRNELQERLLTFEAALNEIEVERLALAEQFRELAHAIDRDVLAVSAEIESRFAKYIQGFLAERCDIKYTPRQKRIGQRTVTESFPFPHFVPALTSGVQRDSTTIREAVTCSV